MNLAALGVSIREDVSKEELCQAAFAWLRLRNG